MKYGDVLRISDEYLQWQPTAYRDRRVMFIHKPVGIHATVVVLQRDPHEKFRSPKPGEIEHIEVLSWQVVEDAS